MGAIQEVKAHDIYELLDVAYAEGNVKLDDYLNRVLSKAEEWFVASGISVFLRKADTDTFELAAAGGLLSKVPKNATIQAGQGIAGLAIAEQRARLLVDITDEKDLREKGVKKNSEIGSSLIVPLSTKNSGCIGVLNVARATNIPAFSESDLDAAESLGRQIALAVNNARAIVNANSRRISLQSAIESVGFGLIMVDASGEFNDFTHEAGTILGADPARCAKWDDFVDQVRSTMQQPLRHGMIRAKKGLSYRFRSADEHGLKAYAVVMSPLQNGGVIIAINDVTEHEKARETVDRIHRLAEIGQMTASIAHEIRNPLAGIQSAASMILEDPQLAGEFAGLIEREATKLNKLCSEFLDFAKPVSLEFDAIKLGDVAREVARRLVSQFQDAQVGLKLQISPDEPMLYADKPRLEQVVLNLMLNALQASEAGHTVTVNVNSSGTLKVIDEGCGMDQQTLDRLYTPFFTTKHNGAGLGLSIVRKIIDSHKAKIEVKSTVGMGTVFELHFNAGAAA